MNSKNTQELLLKSRKLKEDHKQQWEASKKELAQNRVKRKAQYQVRLDMIAECLNYINKYDTNNTWKLVKNKISGYYKIVEYSVRDMRVEFQSKELADILAHLTSARQFLIANKET